MRLHRIESDIDRCGLGVSIQLLPFNQYKQLPRIKGLYSIWQGDRCIYVGQGGGNTGIRGRFDHHHNKAYGLFETRTGKRNSTQDGQGWRNGRESDWWDPSTWEIEFFACPKAVHRTYLEGAMMLVLNPICNDESWEDIC